MRKFRRLAALVVKETMMFLRALLRLDILGPLLLLLRALLLPLMWSAMSLYMSLSLSGSLCHIRPSLLAVCTMLKLGCFLWIRRRCFSMKMKNGGSGRPEDLKRTLFP